jgi:hypothetical protein
LQNDFQFGIFLKFLPTSSGMGKRCLLLPKSQCRTTVQSWSN